MKKTTFWTKLIMVVVMLFSLSGAFAQLTKPWSFNAAETKVFADFFKQPSAELGKTNAEVMGIDINRTGFTWDDMNTWADTSGTVFFTGSTDAYARTIWGGGFSANTTYQGRLHYLFMSAHKNSSTGKYDETGGFQELPADFSSRLLKLSGTMNLGSVICGVINISGTSIQKVSLALDCMTDCYCNIRRNPKLKQIDISGSKGHIRQFELYSNALEGTSGFVKGDAGWGAKPLEFGDWLTNLDNNCFTFSAMPSHPAYPTRTDFKWGSYKQQYDQKGGMPIGTLVDAKYYAESDEDIDLSSEYDIRGSLTTYTWKNADGDVIVPAGTTTDGWFYFSAAQEGQQYRCEMTNAAYPALVLKTVFVNIVQTIPANVSSALKEEVKVMNNPVGDQLLIKAASISQVDVYNTAGVIVKRVKDPSNVISMSGVTPGLYVVKIMTPYGVATQTIVKK